MGEDIKGGGRERVRVIKVERLLFASLGIVMRGAGVQKKVNQRLSAHFLSHGNWTGLGWWGFSGVSDQSFRQRH